MILERLRKILSGAPGAESASGHKARGDTCLQEGDLEGAASFYREALAADPDHLDACLNLGFVLLEQGNPGAARTALERAIEISPDAADAFFMLGAIARLEGNASEAVFRLEKAIALQPGFARACVELCQLLHETGDTDGARRVLLRGLEASPQSPELHYYLGNLQAVEKNYEEAAASYRSALALQPEYPEAMLNLALLFHQQGRYEEAVAHGRQATAMRPDHIEAIFACGNALVELKRFDEALRDYARVLQFVPNHAQAMSNRGRALLGLERYTEALQSFDQALAHQPALIEALFNRGAALDRLRRYRESIDTYDKLLAVRPDYVDAYCNRGIALTFLGRHDDAIRSYESALALRPDDPDAHLAASMSRLLLGDFQRGLEQYEWRSLAPFQRRHQRNFNAPLWLGEESLAGKTILLHAEQGFGDSIQFVRYVSMVARLGARVLLEVQPALQRLFSGLDGAHTVLAKGQELPAFDFHCPLMSLPRAFRTDLQSIPAEVPYLYADPARKTEWASRLPVAGVPRVGLVWSGNADHKNDHFRSIPLADLIHALPENFQYVSLQKELRSEERSLLESSGRIVHYGDQLTDFAETAALASQLDLVVSVDTSVAHLAGAMGMPVWLMLAANPDWRWLLQRTDSPWYPSMKLFRQAATGSWHDVLQSVAGALTVTAGRPGSEA
jgi:tetratricopeptide (TPR) repeat protein